MITSDRARVALATGEYVYTPDGTAVVITAVRAVPAPRSAGGGHLWWADIAGPGYTGTAMKLVHLTIREDVRGRAE
jgi:hypothetical protein